jgi:glycine dehydrogenase subunit 1
MGQEGFAEAARQCHSKAVYFANQLSEVPGYERVYPGEFFNEFVTQCPDAAKALNALEDRGILGGLPVGMMETAGTVEKKRLLWCVTEVNTKEEIDETVGILKGLKE